VADEINWLDGQPPTRPHTCQIKIRYNSPAVPGQVQAQGTEAVAITFDQPVSAVTPGQAVVCYDGDRVIGGGWIRDVGRVG